MCVHTDDDGDDHEELSMCDPHLTKSPADG